MPAGHLVGAAPARSSDPIPAWYKTKLVWKTQKFSIV